MLKGAVGKILYALTPRPSDEGPAMMIPFWDYTLPNNYPSEGSHPHGSSTSFDPLSMAYRVWNANEERIQLCHPAHEAHLLGLSVDNWYETFIELHESGGVEWDALRKFHYFVEVGLEEAALRAM